MANIKLTPEELLAQSTELSSLQTEFESLFSQVTNSLNGLNESWSESLSSNFAGKITAAQKSFASVTNMLTNGASAARVSANGFTTPGAVLALLCGGDTSAMDDISELTSWIMENGDQLGTNPSRILEALAEMNGIDTAAARDVIEKIGKGDYEGALQTAGEKGINLLAGMMSNGIPSDSWVGDLQELTGGKLGLDGLEKAYYKNLFGDTAGNAANIVKDMYSDNPDYGYELNQLGQFAWNIGPGAVIKAGTDAAVNVVEKIPIIGDYYTAKGVTDGEGAISSMIGDVTYMVTGDREAASADANYYRQHGGIAKGVVDGVVDIGSFVGEKIGSAWHSVFGN